MPCRSIQKTGRNPFGPNPTLAAAAGIAPAVEDDLVTLNFKALGRHAHEVPGAPDEVEQPPALFAQEKVVVGPFGAFVVGRSALKLDEPDAAIPG